MSSRPSNRTENLNLNGAEYRDGKTVLCSFPPVLFLELTQNCNLHCQMCRSAAGYTPSLDMDPDLFARIRDELFSLATIVDLRGWGESTILKSIANRIAETVLAGPQIRLVTNALAINRDLWKQLMAADAHVVVSVDAATADTMRALGRGSFTRLFRSLEAGACERDAVVNGRGSIAFNTVLTSHNLDEFVDIIRLAARFGVSRVTAFPVVARRSSSLHLEQRRDDIPDAIMRAGVVAQEVGVDLRLGASPHEEMVVVDGLPSRCSHPWEYCYIDFAGKVGYCDHLIGNARLTLGSLIDSSFEEIWNGEEFQRLRRLHVDARRGQPGEVALAYPHCGWCYMRRYVDFEDVTDPSAGSRVVATSSQLPLIRITRGPHFRGDFM